MTNSAPRPESSRPSSGRPSSGAGRSGSQRPGSPRPRRRFGGTAAQIRAALTFYKIFAYSTGTMLLLLCLELIARYGFDVSLMAGGTDAVTGDPFGLGFVEADSQATIGSVNLSTTVLIVHGWMYVVYLISDFRLWSLMRWPFGKFVLIALGGVIPLLSFFTEKKIHRQVSQELDENPQASSRY